MLIGANCDVDHGLDVDRVVVPIDGSEKSTEAIPLGLEWARRLGVSLWLVSVTDPEAMRTVRRHVGDDASVVESNHLHNPY